MFQFSKDAETADGQVRAIVFYLVTIGYADGVLEQAELDYIRSYVARLAAWRIAAEGIEDETEQHEQTQRQGYVLHHRIINQPARRVVGRVQQHDKATAGSRNLLQSQGAVCCYRLAVGRE